MASDNRNSKNNNHDGLFWVFTVFIFLLSPALGILLALIKLISSRNKKSQYTSSKNRRTTSSQQRRSSQNWQDSTAGRNRTTWDDYQPQYEPRTDRARPQDNPPGQHASGNWRSKSTAARLTSSRQGRNMMIAGAILTVLFGFTTISEFLDNFSMLQHGHIVSFFSSLYVLVFLTGVGILLLWFGRKRMKRAERYREYISIIGNRNLISAREIAEITGRKIDEVCTDLTDLITQGALGTEVYFDRSKQQLILNAQGREELHRMEEQAREQARLEEEARKREASPEYALLSDIRQLNDDIADPKISMQIDRIEEITGLILRYQADHPESEAQLHKFLSYYLPTTLKLLRTYADLEDQSVQGTNITETRKKIGELMGTIVNAFELQYDRLFADNRMDIESEITVLENMMRQDGLTSNEDNNPFAQFRTQTH